MRDSEHYEREIHDLQEEIENFKKEKERVRLIIGNIGGMPGLNTHVFNIFFSVFILADLFLSIFLEGKWRLALVDLAIAAVSFKIMYFMYHQMRLNHLQIWILSSLEWRINELSSHVKSQMKDKKE